MYFEMVKYEMVFKSAVKTLTCSNRWQLDSRCCWCGSGLNRTRKGDHVNNELSDRSFWKKNTQISGYLSVFRHTDPTLTASIYAAAVMNVVKLVGICFVCLTILFCRLPSLSLSSGPDHAVRWRHERCHQACWDNTVAVHACWIEGRVQRFTK